MSIPNNMKFVRFDLYCPDCKHSEKNESDMPCHYCLGVGARENDPTPECFEEAKK